tara:strand:- start:34 stop:549 length:516 start_codon:yes stop_codon:yes gene_type:complete
MTTRYIFYDFETTGLDPTKDKIIEMAFLDDAGNKFESFVNPSCNLPQKITDITGITNEMLINAPPLDVVLKNLYTYLNDRPEYDIYLIAHNNHRFDQLFFINAFKTEFNTEPDYNFIDTLKIFKRLLPKKKSYSMQNLCKEFKLDIIQDHRAMSDVLLLKDLYTLIMNTCK